MPMTSDVQEFAEALRRLLRQDMNDFADAVSVNNGVNDFALYKNLTGTISGLVRAERHLLDLLQKAKDADE